MPSWYENMFYWCMNARSPPETSDDEEEELGVGNALAWSKDLEKHYCGELSYAVCQANQFIEDYSHVEIGKNVILVGIYDGHGGPQTANFIRDHLIDNLLAIYGSFMWNLVTVSIEDKRTIDEATMRETISAVEDEFLSYVRVNYNVSPQILKVGSCCLVGVIWNGVLQIANLGDSRAIVGSVSRCNKLSVEQLTVDHNVNRDEIRQEVRDLHPNDPDIVSVSRGAWRIEGVIQVSRSIGDVYLKNPVVPEDPLFPKPRFGKAVVSAEPALLSRVLHRHDKFLIFASDGLWQYLSNEQAAEIVHLSPRDGVAKKLVRAALKAAAKAMKVTYQALLNADLAGRRVYHDDITVIVVFLDHRFVHRRDTDMTELSIKGILSVSESHLLVITNADIGLEGHVKVKVINLRMVGIRAKIGRSNEAPFEREIMAMERQTQQFNGQAKT
ncbi:unnamed protein product [Sphenostylis stenocarpa]|uniref:protein-serine/threonine phosphatase n=1 Tax=Sphenostylis stenocarpa TaxID=92480 RepID=A0AA86V378_9FABA|nr:unnamed protein product [Sphenostylis stenocarpa]